MNILKNIILFLSSLIVAVCVAEFIAGKINIEGLSGHKMYAALVDDKIYLSPETDIIVGDKNFEFYSGDCYPSDPAGRFPLKVINNDKYWYCVLYDLEKRLQGFNPERKKQMTIVGDSFAFGQGVKDTETLGYLLNKNYPDINFQNRSMPGYNISDVARRCKKIAETASDMEEVVYFYNLNDVLMSEKLSSRTSNIIDFQNVNWKNDEESSGFLVSLFQRSALFSLIRKVWILNRESYRTVQYYKDMYSGEGNRREFLSTMDEICSIKEMLKRRGISFRVVIYPLMYKDLLGRYPFESIHIRIINACNERGVECLDGFEPFKDYYSLKKFTVHPIDQHPNGLANRIMIDYMQKRDFLIKK